MDDVYAKNFRVEIDAGGVRLVVADRELAMAIRKTAEAKRYDPSDVFGEDFCSAFQKRCTGIVAEASDDLALAEDCLMWSIFGSPLGWECWDSRDVTSPDVLRQVVRDVRCKHWPADDMLRAVECALRGQFAEAYSIADEALATIRHECASCVWDNDDGQPTR